MSENTKIEWCDHTFNPWEGCTKVSPGCANCYAEARDKRFTRGIHWGKGAPRRLTSDTNWKLPVKWNKTAICANCGYGELIGSDDCRKCGHAFSLRTRRRPRVFCASLSDWLDDEVPIEWLAKLLALIHATPHLDWLLLSKRPQNWHARIISAVEILLKNGTPSAAIAMGRWEKHGAAFAPSNVWIGTTVEDQARADERIPQLLAIPARLRFLSCEPLLEGVDLSPMGIHLVICGGESGHFARPMNPDWARGLRDQCAAAGVSFHFKQWGQHDADGNSVGKHAAGRLLDGVEHNAFPA